MISYFWGKTKSNVDYSRIYWESRQGCGFEKKKKQIKQQANKETNQNNITAVSPEENKEWSEH